MLRITDQQMIALRTVGMRALRPTILSHWQEVLPAATERVGPEGRDRILTELEALAQEDAELTQLDLAMLADLLLVGAASEARTSYDE